MTAEIEAKCKNCIHWEIDPGAVQSKYKLLKNIESLDRSYGKCRANFIDDDGAVVVYDIGTNGETDCKAIDENDEILFEPVPEG